MQLFRSGQAYGHGEVKVDEWAHSAKSATNTACAKAQGDADTVCDKPANNAQSAQEGKEQAAGFIQQVIPPLLEFKVKNGDTSLISKAVAKGEEELMKACVKEEVEVKPELPEDFRDLNL